MPDYSLFGDEHVRQYEAIGTKRDIPVVLLRSR